MNMIHHLSLITIILFHTAIFRLASARVPLTACRSYCGNLTIDYPFALRPGCGHAGFRDLLFCVNGVLMMHIPSGSYRVLDIDYAYHGITLHDPAMSDCYTLDRSPKGRGNGFVVEPWRAVYLQPDQDNIFMLLGCRSGSPLFQGFPNKHLPCRSNVSGMSCDDYYRCPAWDGAGVRSSAYGNSNPPECCAVEPAAVRSINISHLQCEGYSSAYSVAPLRPPGPGAWTYGLRLSFSLPENNDGFCGACRSTGGVCGYDQYTHDDVCICGDWNSTSNCDSLGLTALAPRTELPCFLATLAACGTYYIFLHLLFLTCTFHFGCY
ncbi:Wall-associated receptor kinase 3 [Rhynchospora pubera]|uniref:Wall-associated receptor kinase 3 n=1 Tax=Rhynchospora pubera TaxID=906938 RepID=A0AAV8F742_9POAL|nr:Wall-associated receptor kinase 3 [Rhynchospora pubera]